MPTERVTISKRYCLAAIVCLIMMITQLGVLCSQVTVYSADFENNLGDNNWTLGNTASDGNWIIGTPSPYLTGNIQMEIPAFEGSQDLVTGFVFNQDVDGGATLARSPNIDLPEQQLTLDFEYYFAYFTNGNSTDELSINLRRAADDNLLQNLVAESGNNSGQAASWSHFSVDISQLAGETIYIEVLAADRGAGSKIEAALDMVVITSLEGLNGSVYLDVNDNGVKDADEDGIAGILVSAFDSSGIVSQMTSDVQGNYIFTGLDSQVLYQIIFEGWEIDYVESSLGPDNAGSIQQGSLGPSSNSLGLRVPNTSCSDPFLLVPCYVEGDLVTSGSEPAILKLPSSANGHDFTGINPSPGYQAQSISTYDDVGTVYGIAWQQTTRRYYAGAFHKRYTSFGPSGPDAIYQLDLNGNLTGVINLDDITFVNNVAGSDVHDFTSTFNGSLLDLGVGNSSFDGVGKRSLGDIEIDDDFATLYVMNLFDRIIYAVDVSSGIANNASIINSWPAPDATSADRHRPFGLAWHEDKLWIGSVDEDGSEAYVHILDVETGAFDLVLTIPLDYPRQAFLGTADNPDAPGAWNPWQSTPNFTPHEVDQEIAFPQAMLTDIEFSDEGDMILGFRDRFGDQGGAEKFFNVGDLEQTWVISQGEILKACPFDLVQTSFNTELEDLANQGLFSPFEVMDDPDASGGQFIVWPEVGGNNLFNSPTDISSGQVQIEFTLTELADVVFQIRVDFPNGGDNSFFYRIDGGNWLTRNGGSTNGWEILDIITFNNLSAGTHTLDIHRREDGSLLDHVTLTASAGSISSPVSSDPEPDNSLFALESGLDADCPVSNSGLSNSGPGNSEFYYWDIYALQNLNWDPSATNGAFHWETAQGGLVQIPGSPSIFTTALDPFDDFSGGILKLDNTTGAREGVPLVGPVNPDDLVGGYTIYESGDFNNGLPPANGFSAKANGLGDLEAACSVDYAIGNFVWFDEDQDGRQDSDEPPLSGVIVELYEDDVLIGRDTTDEFGHYFFGGISGSGLIDNASVVSGVNYQLRISITSAQSNSSNITEISGITEADLTDDRLDSDAQSNGSFAFINILLDETQITDYSFDFGFASCAISLESYLDDTTLCQGEQLSIFADVIGDSVSNHLWKVSSSTTSSGFTFSGTSTSTLSLETSDATPGVIILTHSAVADGCPVSDSLEVSIISRPEIAIISSLDTTCIGEEVQLTATRAYEIFPIGGLVPPSEGPGFSQGHTIFDIEDPSATLVRITLPTWDDHFAETTINGQVIFPEVLQPNSWNAGGMDTETPWIANVNGLPRSVIEITETSVRYFRTRTTTSPELEEVFPSNWVSTPQPFRSGNNEIEFGILNTAGPVGGSWTIEAEAVVGYDYLWSTGDTTQMITDTPSEVTEYMVTVTNSQNCSSVASRMIFAGVNNTESITYNGCSGDGYQVLVGGTLYNEANPTDTVVINTASGCDSTFYINLDYDIPPTVEAGSIPTPLCSTSILILEDLNASISGGVASGIWTSTGGGSFDNGGIFGGVNSATTYTPSESEITAGKVILTLTSDDPPGSCEPEADAVMVLISDIRCNTFPWSGG